MHIVVVIPCLNEALTIGGVVTDFRRALPVAEIVVIDNGSTDDTAKVAAASGAKVLCERRRGKGHAVRKALRLVEADVYLLVDGDGTYPAADAPKLVQPVLDDDADVVVGGRLDPSRESEFRWLNRFGNRLFLATVNAIFRTNVSDLLTGYRAMSRAFVKETPILSTGFELETELTILALERGFRTFEIPVTLASRPKGSHSKIRFLGDGLRILSAIFTLLRDYRPLTFFGTMGAVAALIGLGFGTYVSLEFIHTGQVRIPMAVLASGLGVVGISLALTGIILTTLARRFREVEHLITGLDREVRLSRSRTTSEAPPRT